MRLFTLTFFMCLAVNQCLLAQPQGFSKTKIDSLEKLLNKLPNDTNRVNTLFELATLYSNTSVEKSILIGEEALKLIRKLNYSNGFRKGLGPLSFQYTISGQWAKGLELALEGKERYKDVLNELSNYSNMAQLAYQFQGDYKRCLEECYENIQLFDNHPEVEFSLVDKWATYMSASEMYSNMQQGDSALTFALQSLGYAQNIQFNTMHFVGYAHNAIGKAFLKQNMPDSALYHLHIMRVAMEQIDNHFALQETQIYLSKAMQNKGIRDSMYYYAKTAYDGAVKMGNDINEMNAALILSEYFDKSNPAQSLFYLKRYNAIKEKVFTQDQTNKRYFLESEQRNKLIELEKKEINTKNRIKQNSLLGSLLTFVLLAVILIYTNRRKRLLNDKLQQQKIQIENQNRDLVQSSKELATKNNDLKIEVALDQVRARSLEMHKSDELKEVVATLYDQLRVLGFKYGAASILIMDSIKNDLIQWVGGFDQSEYPIGYHIKSFNHPAYIAQFSAWKNGDKYLELLLTDDEKRSFDEYMFTQTDFKKFPEEGKAFMKSLSSVVFSLAFLKYGALQWGPEKLNDEQAKILQKFAVVFEQAYTRFLDLQKAEAQAREAEIEASLERIRSRAMAMNTSEEFNSLLGFMYVECTKLNMHLDRGFIMTFNKATKDAYWWMVSADALEEPLKILVEYHEYAPNLAILKGWEEREQRWSYILEGNNKKTWDDYQFANALSQLPAFVKDNMRSVKSVILNASFQNFGCIMLSSFDPLSDDQFDLIQKFSKVFDQTYTRFLDLQKAEAQAREAQIEASFERIRASALAMQTSNEFSGVVQTLYVQINALGQKELEATIIQFYDIEQGFINSWNAQNVDKSSAGNITLGTTHIPFDACRLTLEWLNAYQSNQEDYTIIAKDDILEEWLLLLMTMSPEIKDRLGESMPQISNFHFSKFSRGALSMVSQKPFSEEPKYLLKRAASAFDLAYKRYLDLQLKEEQAIKLADEKQRLEAALKELQTTQAQLIQSEKLASLGELTAGIAHEIQNPLNFVNNFSELSVDLAKELKEERSKELGKRDEDLENDLIDDLISNQEKINHHGKRASDIVKGMLEHSRTSTGQKESTDLNALCNDYLRLAYQGQKAKNKDFNATMETHFDPNLPKIDIIPQDIGRVILNLINNAFYAVSEKLKVETSKAKSRPSGSEKAGSDYEPKVTITTQLTANSQLLITVKDNGSGIPCAIKDKIFQPFFTTKPTGQGTGLGLSLAFDIVTKGHGGSLEVVSNEEVGSEFIIFLPFKNN